MGERVGQITKVPEVKKSSSNSRVRRTERFQSMDTPVNRILFLQRTAGNQAVSRLMKSKALQAKLRIGQPGDVYEQEADRVADAVMRMPEPGVQRQVDEEEEEEMLQAKPLAGQITPLVQRQIEPEEEEEEEEMLQAQSREDATSEVPNDLESQINAIRGGQPLAESERAYFEPRFGADFSQVRLHTDSQAAESARAVNARAFTVGQDVVFGAGQYSRGTSEGRNLMAHELVHTLQQSETGHYVQRYALCESQEECPLVERVRGEIGSSRSNPMMVRNISGPVHGLLIANFTVGSSSLKSDLESNSIWANYWGQMVTNTNIRWEVLGFSDCPGEEETDELLRWERAIAVNNALPQLARNQVDGFRAAPLNDCISNNADEQSRSYNRSAFIRQKKTEYTFEEDTITGKLQGTIEVKHESAINQIIPVAKSHVGSSTWAKSANKHPYGPKTNKCNLFVYDVLNEAGASVQMKKRDRGWFKGIFVKRYVFHPPLAGQWANPGVSIPGWIVVKTPQVGDVAAEAIQYSDATGHVGIVSEVTQDGKNGKTISATTNKVVENDWGFRGGQNVVFKRYKGR